MHAPDRLANLQHVSIFRGAARSTLDRVANICRWQTYVPGNVILFYQDNSTDVFFILQGRVRASIYAPDGKVMLFTDIGRGEIFGEIAALDGGPRSASIEALEPTLVAAMGAAEFEGILRDDAEVALATLRLLTGRVRRLSDRAYEFRALAVQNRIHAELLRLSKAAGAGQGRGQSQGKGQGDTEAVLSPAPTLAEIADRVSTHREAVSRELSRLGALGLIGREGGDLRILDVRRLAKLVREARGE